ncbi:MAG: Lrp/AsnC family transcriptional regulator [Planctomycetota bacterium]
MSIDDLDVRLIAELRSSPRVGVVELSRRLSVARGTVQSRLERLTESGVITGFGPDLDLERVGFGVKAYVTIEVKQGVVDADMVKALSAIPEVLEVYSVAAQGDLLCQVVARSNEHIMRILERVLAIPGTARTNTAIVLKSQIRQSGLALLEQLTETRE